MDAMELSVARAPAHRGRIEPERHDLREREHEVLARRQRGELGIKRAPSTRKMPRTVESGPSR